MVKDTKFGTSFFIEMLLNAVKYRGYRFYRFWVIKGKSTGGKITPATQIRVKKNNYEKSLRNRKTVYNISKLRGVFKTATVTYPKIFWEYHFSRGFQGSSPREHNDEV